MTLKWKCTNNRSDIQTEIEQFDWFVEQIQTRTGFGWISESSAEKTSCQKIALFRLRPLAQLFEGRTKFNPGFFFLYSKAFSQIISSVIFRASNHQLVDKRIKTEILFKPSNLNSNLTLTLGYLNLALNNSALFFFAPILLLHRLPLSGKSHRYKKSFFHDQEKGFV